MKVKNNLRSILIQIIYFLEKVSGRMPKEIAFKKNTRLIIIKISPKSPHKLEVKGRVITLYLDKDFITDNKRNIHFTPLTKINTNNISNDEVAELVLLSYLETFKRGLKPNGFNNFKIIVFLVYYMENFKSIKDSGGFKFGVHLNCLNQTIYLHNQIWFPSFYDRVKYFLIFIFPIYIYLFYYKNIKI